MTESKYWMLRNCKIQIEQDLGAKSRMRHFISVMATAVLFSAGCAPSMQYITDTATIDTGLHEALVNSPIQKAATAALGAGMREMDALAGAVVILDANTGQIVSFVSIVGESAKDAKTPKFNRAANNVHELGRVMAIFPIAQAFEEGLITKDTEIDTPQQISVGGVQIRDWDPKSAQMTPAEVFVNGSNVGTAQIAKLIGPGRQKLFLEDLGFLESNPIEQLFPTDVETLRPTKWPITAAATISFGHGLSVSPLQLAAGYACLVNGGMRITPSFAEVPRRGKRVVSEETSDYVRELLRSSVVNGTARFADVPGHPLGGVTGSSDLRLPNGQFSENQFVATFAAIFPYKEPRYVIVTLLEDPGYSVDGEKRKTAGWTVAPVTRKIIEETAPYLGVRK